MIWYLLTIALAVAADQLTKWAIVAAYPTPGDGTALLPGILHFTHVDNTGAAFGMLKDSRWVFLVVSTVAIAAMLVYLIKWPPKHLLTGISFALVIGGGIGNMIDRVARGYVIDFIDFCAFPKIWKYIFNVADVCVCVGCAGLVICLLFLEAKKDKPQEGAPQNETPQSDAPQNETPQNDAPREDAP